MRTRSAILAMLLLAAIAGCSPAATTSPPIPADAIHLSAQNLQFSTDSLAVPAGKPFTIALDILESAAHNVAIYTDDSYATVVYREDPKTGPGTFLFNVPALAAGTYAFRCDVHPAMKGTLTAG
jgi:plastocyanin